MRCRGRGIFGFALIAMSHKTTADFWELYNQLPLPVRRTADKNYELLKADLRHPSLHFKEVHAGMWSVRVGVGYRALATFEDGIYNWFWIGSHAEYNRLIS